MKRTIFILIAVLGIGLVAACGVSSPSVTAKFNSKIGRASASTATGPDISQDGLVLWLDAADLALADGATVSVWPDASPAANTVDQSVVASQPTYMATGGPNGMPALSFDGLGDHMEITSLTYRTIIIVGEFANPLFADYHGILGSNPDNNGALPHNGYLVNGVGGTSQFAQGATAFTAAYMNGALIPFVVTGHDFNPIDTPWIASFILDQDSTFAAQLGSIDRVLLGTRHWFGRISEVIVYDKVLTDPERVAVETYLNGKYAIF